MNLFRKNRLFCLSIFPLVALSLIVLITSGCSLFSDYYALSYEEKDQFAELSNDMTLSQRMAYLEKPTEAERVAYLNEIGLLGDESNLAQKTANQEILPTDQERFDLNNLPTRKLSAQEKTAYILLPSQVSNTKSPPPRVDYDRTGNSLTDVLTLIELYERGLITREQFVHEKSIAMQETNANEEIAANTARPLAPLAVQEPQSSIPPVSYEKSGDPLMDVLTLMELYGNRQITREQFLNEKELALSSH